MTPERFARRDDVADYAEVRPLAREPRPRRVRHPAVQPGPPARRLERLPPGARHARARLTDDQTAAIKWLAAQPGGPAKVLVISEDWSSDCRRDVPYLARLAEAGGLELRIVVRDPDTMLRKGLPEPGSHDNADLVREYANDKNGARWASIPVAVFFTKDFVELYRYVEYPAVYQGQGRGDRPSADAAAGRDRGAIDAAWRPRHRRRAARPALRRRLGAGRDRGNPQRPSRAPADPLSPSGGEGIDGPRPAGVYSAPLRHGPVTAKVIPGVWMLKNSHLPSGL